MKRLMRYKTLQCFLAALIMIAFLAPSAYASGAPDTYEASANAVSEKYIGKTVPGACVVISEHDNTVFAKGYGFADLENNTAIDPETTVFEWGSISKTFVWVSVMQLVEDRKIDLETDIRTYLPDGFLKNLRFAEPVTLIHLMNCALPGFVDSKNEEKTERNAGYLVVSQSGGGMLRQGTRKGIRRTPANRGMRAHWVVKGLDISEDVCHGMCP